MFKRYISYELIDDRAVDAVVSPSWTWVRASAGAVFPVKRAPAIVSIPFDALDKPPWAAVVALVTAGSLVQALIVSHRQKWPGKKFNAYPDPADATPLTSDTVFASAATMLNLSMLHCKSPIWRDSMGTSSRNEALRVSKISLGKTISPLLTRNC